MKPRPGGSQFSDGRRGGSSRRWAGTLVALLFAASASADGVDPAPLRFGFSTGVFVDVNEKDARAALRVWTRTLGEEHDLPVDATLPSLPGVAGICEALGGEQVDAVTMTVVELWGVRKTTPVGETVVVAVSQGKTTQQYLLLTHRDNQATQLADLRGQSIAILGDSLECLPAIWMETQLLEHGFGRAEDFWRKTSFSGKISRVVLPVFFRQVAACIVTEEGFATMCELNPQVGTELKVIAQSPPFIPAPLCFRRNLASPLVARLIAKIGEIGKTAAGRQTLTLFHSDQITARPFADLEPSLALLDRHAQLLAARSSLPAGPKP
jgi:ABC-type phosphate/phosphonate transport system substrate-binding protein